ncbi:MAG TPA: hypothetical protein VJ978_08120, partial [Nitriliruptoraceae bacterium]|nr:hypothetical protein [Nitriliruptoraceae bacterium]
MDTSLALPLAADTPLVLLVTMKGASISAQVNGAFAGSWAFNSAVADGAFGLLVTAGVIEADDVRVRTNGLVAGTASTTSTPSASTTAAAVGTESPSSSVDLGVTTTSAIQTSTVLVVLDGATGVTYDGPVTIQGIDVPALTLPSILRRHRGQVAAAIVALLNEAFTDLQVKFTLTPPADGPYSVVYVGGSGDEFVTEFGELWGIAEGVDAGNLDPSDKAFVFSDAITLLGFTVDDFARALVPYIGHEVGHLFGLEHAMHIGGEEDVDPGLVHMAWKPYTHIEIAKDVRNDILDDGMLTIAGHDYPVHPLVVEAITYHAGYYFAGTVGPDGFPDLVMGQSLIHPIDTGTWLARVLDMAWQAQEDGAPFTQVERLQILAFAYGYATHAAGDFWAHTLVNEFTEGEFPGVLDLAGDDRDLANAVRHFMAEGYVGDATPGLDLDGTSSLLPDGDISDDATPGIVYDAPLRFIYETLIKAFPGDPTAEANTGLRPIAAVDGGAGSGQDYFELIETADVPLLPLDLTFRQLGFRVGIAGVTIQLGDGVDPAQVFDAFGFGSADGRYTVTGISPDGLRLYVDEQIDVGGGDLVKGDEWLTTKPSRGLVIDQFVTLKGELEALADTLDAVPGTTPVVDTYSDLEQELLDLLTDGDPGTNPDAELLDHYARAYLRNWILEIEDGLANWGTVGLALTRALFDPQARRRMQNIEGQLVGADIDPRRQDYEAGVTPIDVFLYELDDPNQDGDLSDSYISNHLLAMFGVPQALIDVREALGAFGEVLDDVIVGPLGLAGNPFFQTKEELAEIPKAFLRDFIETKYGIPFDLFEQLNGLANKMDLKSIDIGSRHVEVFTPSDHERLDSYMGIEGIVLGADIVVQTGPGFEFYADAAGSLDENVEFDKQAFAAYRNSVTLAKLLLLHETMLLEVPDPSDGQLSAFVNDNIAAGWAALSAGQQAALQAELGYDPSTVVYDWSELQVWGAHGGNFLTT